MKLLNTVERYPSQEPWLLPSQLRLKRKTQMCSNVTPVKKELGSPDLAMLSPEASRKRKMEETPTSTLKQQKHEQKRKMSTLTDDPKNKVLQTSVVPSVMQSIAQDGLQPYSLKTLGCTYTACMRWNTYIEARKMDRLQVPTIDVVKEFLQSTLTSNVKTSDLGKASTPLTCKTVQLYLWHLRKIVFPRMYPSAFAQVELAGPGM